MGVEALYCKPLSGLCRRSKNKLYALHAPEVERLATGNALKPYECIKVSITTTHVESLVGARARSQAVHTTSTCWPKRWNRRRSRATSNRRSPS
ncbi:transposase domain protein [Burkholderia pseudomallei MSHR7343]|nr:transposase domain protein [Burkholderia pseudomallei MSHR5608]KGS31050.1 transposase domain protein [Burkholderia pseudomallei MSHR4378]KGS34768.1 transposase domain protein [Burkholderia pseudomallei MSHR7343]